MIFLHCIKHDWYTWHPCESSKCSKGAHQWKSSQKQVHFWTKRDCTILKCTALLSGSEVYATVKYSPEVNPKENEHDWLINSLSIKYVNDFRNTSRLLPYVHSLYHIIGCMPCSTCLGLRKYMSVEPCLRWQTKWMNILRGGYSYWTKGNLVASTFWKNLVLQFMISEKGAARCVTEQRRDSINILPYIK